MILQTVDLSIMIDGLFVKVLKKPQKVLPHPYKQIVKQFTNLKLSISSHSNIPHKLDGKNS